MTDPAPPPDAPLLVLFDADCGFCLYGRDLLRRWDRRGRLRTDLIQRHVTTTLAGVTPAEQLATWHAIHPDGRRETEAAALVAVLERLPLGRVPAGVVRALPRPANRAYRWVAAHRTGISRLLRTQGHPERGAAVIANVAFGSGAAVSMRRPRCVRRSGGAT